MKNFLKQAKRFCIIALVFIFSVSLVSPALAIGISIDNHSTPLLIPGQNNLWGVINDGSVAGASLMKMQTYNSGNFINRLVLTPAGNLSVSGYVSSSQVCIAGSCQATWPSGGMGGGGTAGYDAKFTGASTLGNGNIYNNGANVGIGTTVPVASLDVRGTASQEGVYIAQTNTSNTNTGLEVYATGVANQNALQIGSRIAGAGNYLSDFIVQTSGNIGIGTNNINAWNNNFVGINIGGNSSIMTDKAAAGADLRLFSNAYYDGAYKYIANGYATGMWLDSSAGAFDIQTAPSGSANGALSWTGAFHINNNGNIGIGTVAPSAKLQVSAPSGVQPLTLNSTSQYEVAQLIGPTYPSLLLTYNGGGTDYISNYNNTGLALSANTPTWGTAHMFIANSGNVGIGTTAPLGKLDIYLGNGVGVGWDAGLTLVNGSNRGNFIEDNNILRIRNSGSGGFQVATNGAGYSMTILDNGNVGIGNSSPSYRLDVSGDIRAQGAWLRTTGNTGWYSDSYGGGMYMQDSTWVRTYGSKNFYVDQLIRADGGIVSGSASGPGAGNILATGNITSNNSFTSGISNSGQINLNSNGTYWGNISNPSAQVWSLGYSSGGTNIGTPVLSWTAGGNVGIGTTAPGANLEISDSNAVVAGTIDWLTELHQPNVRQNSGGAGVGIKFQHDANGGGKWAGIAGIDDSNWWSNTVGLSFLTNGGSEKMRIASNGNVGIGTTNPPNTLSVYSTLENGLSIDSASFPDLTFKQSGVAKAYVSTNKFSGVAGWGVGTAQDAMIFYSSVNAFHFVDNNGNNTPFMTIIGGNVGIGTTAPGAKLDVENSGGTYGVYSVASALGVYGSGFVGVAGVGTTGVQAQGTSYDFAGTSGNPSYFQGKVEIGGGGSPNATLEVDGRVNANSSVSCGTQGSVAYGAGCSTSQSGYGFSADSGIDSGLFSDADGHLNIINNGRPSIMTYESGSVAYTYLPYGHLTLNDNSAYKPSGGSWSATSDQRVKKDIVNLDSKTALDKLTSLQAKEYQWINPDAHANDTGVHAAIMAQDLQKVFPDWVTKTDPVGADKNIIPAGDQVLNVGYPNDFNAYLIEALKELKKENQDLQTQNSDKQTQLNNQQKEINAMQAAIANLQK
jgi:hypothetical protein